MDDYVTIRKSVWLDGWVATGVMSQERLITAQILLVDQTLKLDVANSDAQTKAKTLHVSSGALTENICSPDL